LRNKRCQLLRRGGLLASSRPPPAGLSIATRNIIAYFRERPIKSFANVIHLMRRNRKK